MICSSESYSGGNHSEKHSIGSDWIWRFCRISLYFPVFRSTTKKMQKRPPAFCRKPRQSHTPSLLPPDIPTGWLDWRSSWGARVALSRRLKGRNEEFPASDVTHLVATELWHGILRRPTILTTNLRLFQYLSINLRSFSTIMKEHRFHLRSSSQWARYFCVVTPVIPQCEFEEALIW